MERAEPKRPKVLKLMELPTCEKSSKLIDDPNLAIPYTDKEDPNRPNPRHERLLPIWKKSNIERLEPRWVKP
jgi:hypothetical protein